MRRNEKMKPLTGRARGGDATELADNQFKLFENHTTESDKSQIGVADMLRLRDAMITAERRMAEARVAFEIEVAGILARGNGHD